MIRAAFCDDDRSELKGLEELLGQYCVQRGRKIVSAAFHSPLELLAEIEKGVRFDVLFLDVLMPGVKGTDIAREIRQYDNVLKIIFLTSSDAFAVQSYTVGAYDYQMKPIGRERFFQLMDSVILDRKKEERHGLILRCRDGITRIDLSRLEYCEVIGRTLLFYMENGKVQKSTGTMAELYRQLSKYRNFLKPHRSFLVNMEYIRSISSKEVVMESGARIPLPHGKYSEIKNFYLEYAFEQKQVFLT